MVTQAEVAARHLLWPSALIGRQFYGIRWLLCHTDWNPPLTGGNQTPLLQGWINGLASGWVLRK